MRSCTNKSRTYGYTADGLLATTTKASGEWERNVYDGERRVARVERSGATPTDYFSYDVFGNVVTESNSVASVAHLRDNLGMDTNEVTTVGAESISLERAYDDCRRLAVMRRGGGDTTAYAYAADSKLASISNADACVEYAYAPDRRGLGYALTLPNGGVFSHALARHRYIRSNVEKVVNSFNGIAVSDLCYTNDALGRPVSRNADTFAYNPRGELSSAVISSGLYTNAYDSIGNLTLSMATNVYRRWEANSLNQYAKIFSAGDWLAPSYDLDGNMTNHGCWTYAYDDAGRLASVMSNGVLLAANEYDAKSRRVRKITPEYTATFFHDGWNLIEERVAYTNGATETIEYFWGKDLSESLQGAGGVGGLLYVKRGGDIYIPCYDANGNITDYVDASGDVVASYAYDAFGGAISQSGALADAFAHRFSTKYFDTETGLYYYGYRFYSPDLMRWLSRDPIEESGGLNLYAFCRNNPLNGVDFLGNEKITLRYDMSTKFGLGDRIAKPKGTKHIPTAAGVIADIKKQIKPFDKEGEGKCKCIENLYLGGHGYPGGLDLGEIDMYKKIYDEARDKLALEYMGKTPEELFNDSSTDDSVRNYVFFKIISRYLCENAYVEFVTCASGRGSDGQRLKEILQDLLGTTNIKLYETEVCYRGGEIVPKIED